VEDFFLTRSTASFRSLTDYRTTTTTAAITTTTTATTTASTTPIPTLRHHCRDYFTLYLLLFLNVVPSLMLIRFTSSG
jgi:hypothetical protein